MSKKPTPKQKTDKRDTRNRYAAFKRKALKKIDNAVNLVDCPECGAKKLSHVVCKECGKYNGRQVLDVNKSDDNITTIKA